MIINRFETVLADTAAAKDIHYSVRYKVFCDETGFEDAARFPDGKERDSFDEHATHFIVWDRYEREWVGAMRLARADGHQMPCETICDADLKGLSARRSRTVEFSRLCVLGKNRHTESAFRFGMKAPDGNPQGKEIPVFFRQEENEVFLRLLRASFAWGKANDVDYCYFIVTPALTRVLQRFGIPLEKVGSPLEHRGVRIPHSYNVHDAEAGMTEKLPSFASLTRNSHAYVTYSSFVQRGAERFAKAGCVSEFPSDVVLTNQWREGWRALAANRSGHSGKVA